MQGPAWNGGQPAAPGAVGLKPNLAGFQPLQQVAERVGGDTDILLREVEGIRVLCGKQRRLTYLLLIQTFLGYW